MAFDEPMSKQLERTLVRITGLAGREAEHLIIDSIACDLRCAPRSKNWRAGMRRINKNAKELADAASQIAAWLRFDIQTLSDFHEYAHRFGGSPGSNVQEMVLRDALASRGLTLEQFRREKVSEG